MKRKKNELKNSKSSSNKELMPKKKFYTPLNDYIFKQIFGKPSSENIAREFINLVTGKKFKDVKLGITPIMDSTIKEEKVGVLDVKALMDRNTLVDIEVQVAKDKYILKRILWYWAKLYAESLRSGEGYSNAKNVICILIADFDIPWLSDVPEFISQWEITNRKRKYKTLTGEFYTCIIELGKMKNKESMQEEYTRLRNWCMFIKNPEKVSDEVMQNDAVLKEADNKLKGLNNNEYERELAFLREKAIMTEKAVRKTGYEDGKEEGIEKGEAKGKKEGLVEGEKKGKKEGKLEVAKEMRKEGLDVKLIVKLTGLNKKEIEKI